MNSFNIKPCEKEDAKAIIEELNAYNLSRVPVARETWTALDFVVRNKNNTITGGILAGVGYWKGLEIKALWVKEEERHTGLGTYLLQHIEALAKDHGEYVSVVDTFDFQGEEFYKKNGYKVFGKLDDFPKGHNRIYLSKIL